MPKFPETTLILEGTPFNMISLVNKEGKRNLFILDKDAGTTQDVSETPILVALFDCIISARENEFEANRKLREMESRYNRTHQELISVFDRTSPMKLVLKELGKAIRMAEEELGCD